MFLGLLACVPADVSDSKACCLYYVDTKVAQVRRIAISGGKPEIVIDFGKPITEPELWKHRIQGFPFAGVPRSALHFLNVGDLPTSTAVLDAFSSKEPRASIWDTFFASSKPSPWKYAYTTEQRPAADHFHDVNVAVTFSKGALKRLFRFKSPTNGPTPLVVFSDEKALIYDAPKVWIIDLKTDARRVLVEAYSPVAWPRDLRKQERFRPTIHYYGGPRNKGSWTMKDPSDWKLRKP